MFPFLKAGTRDDGAFFLKNHFNLIPISFNNVTSNLKLALISLVSKERVCQKAECVRFMTTCIQRKGVYFVKHGTMFSIPHMHFHYGDGNSCHVSVYIWLQEHLLYVTTHKMKTKNQQTGRKKKTRWMSDQLAHFSITAPLLCHLHVHKQCKHRNTHTMCQVIKLGFSNMTHSLQKTTFSQMCHLTELSFSSALFSVKDSAPLFTADHHIWLQAKTVQKYWNLLLESKDKRDVCVQWATFCLPSKALLVFSFIMLVCTFFEPATQTHIHPRTVEICCSHLREHHHLAPVDMCRVCLWPIIEPTAKGQSRSFVPL